MQLSGSYGTPMGPRIGGLQGPWSWLGPVTVIGLAHFRNPSLCFALALPNRPSSHDSLLLICMAICIVSPPLFLQIQLPTSSTRGTQDFRAGSSFSVGTHPSMHKQYRACSTLSRLSRERDRRAQPSWERLDRAQGGRAAGGVPMLSLESTLHCSE